MIRVLLALALLVSLVAPSGARAADGRTWKDESIYFVMTDRFRDGDPSNDLDARPGDLRWWQGGDLQGVIDELDYIKGLGMTAIWITPVTLQTSGGYHGYWTADFYTIDPHLGDMAKLQELVAKAHAKDLKVILDVVLNHVGYGNTWLATRPDWFHPKCEVVFSIPKSVEDCWLAGLPDLDTENPAVRAYLEDWSLWLIDRTRVDGFRLDTARHLPKEFLREWSAKVRAAHPGFWILGEVYVSDYRVQNDYLAAGLDAVTDYFGYDQIARSFARDGDLSWLRLPVPVAESYLTADPTARATFVDDHDVPRLVGTAPDDAARARLRGALVYLFTQPGIPVVYYGTEIALPGGGDPDNRRMMPWSGDVDTATRDLLTRLATLRRDRPVLRRGSYAKLAAERTEYVFERVLGDTVAVVAINAADEPLRETFALEDAGLVAADAIERGLDAGRGDASIADGQLRLTVAPRSAQVWFLAPARPTAPPAGGAPVAALAVVALLLAGGGVVLLARRRR